MERFERIEIIPDHYGRLQRVGIAGAGAVVLGYVEQGPQHAALSDPDAMGASATEEDQG